MTKKDLHDSISWRIGWLVEILDYCDIKIRGLSYPTLEEFPYVKYEEYLAAHRWLGEHWHSTFGRVREIYKLLPSAIWQRYKNWGDFEDHREVQLLFDAVKGITRTLRSAKKPDLFKRGKVNAWIRAAKKRAAKTEEEA